MKWAFGLGGSFIVFKDTPPFNDEFSNVQIPSFTVALYLGDGFSLGLNFTNTGVNDESGVFDNKYDILTLDFSPRYDFNTSENSLVPYVTSGIGLFVNDKIHNTVAANVGVGCTFWVFERLGIHVLGVYRFGFDETVMVGHTQFSLGVVYRFNIRKASNTIGSQDFNNGCF